MFRFLETIKIKNNELLNIEYHNKRVNLTRQLYFKSRDNWRLEDIISLAGIHSSDTYKCRLVYSTGIESIEIIPYKLRPVSTLKIVINNNIHYSYKFYDRSELENMKYRAQGADDILIIKNEFVTDISYANIVFFNGTQWVTPANPLLQGTKRQMYIEKKIISEQNIRISDLHLFQKARIINAMIDLEESFDIDMDSIFV